MTYHERIARAHASRVGDRWISKYRDREIVITSVLTSGVTERLVNGTTERPITFINLAKNYSPK